MLADSPVLIVILALVVTAVVIVGLLVALSKRRR